MRKISNNVMACMMVFLMAFQIQAYSVQYVFAEEDVMITTEDFLIEDPELLKALAQFDANGDNILTKEEMSSVTELKLDNLPIKSLKGLEAFEIYLISANNCGIESLDGLREMRDLQYLYLEGNEITELGDISEMWDLEDVNLKNNKLSDVAELGKLLEKEYINKVQIAGNPLYDEALEYLFNEYYKPVSIIGTVGTSSFQKLSIYPLSVDLQYMRLGYYGFIDVDVPELEFSIEDSSVATIGEAYSIERYRPTVSSFLDRSAVLKVNLVGEGKTRLKISCGELERYTDVFVLPADETGELKIELDSISDKNIAYAFDNIEKTYSGIISKKKMSEISSLNIDASKAAVTDFESFAAFSSLSSLSLNAYTQEQLEASTGMEGIPNLEELCFTNGKLGVLELKNKMPQLKKIVAAGNEIESIDVANTFDNLEYIDLRNNKISSADAILLPESVKELYLEGNPLSKEEIEKIFINYMFNDDVYGVSGESLPFKLLVDIISEKDLSFEIDNEQICRRRGKEFKFTGDGITVMKVTFGNKVKYVTVVSGEYDEFLPGDVNGDKVQNAMDALEILKYSAKISVSTELINEIADINDDTKLNAEDALEILRIAAKITE